jgi:hypothetical protein
MPTYTIKLLVSAPDLSEADDIACGLSEDCQGAVLEVNESTPTEIEAYVAREIKG